MPTALDEWMEKTAPIIAKDVERIEGLSTAQHVALGAVFSKWVRLTWSAASSECRTELHEKVREYIILGEEIRLIAARK